MPFSVVRFNEQRGTVLIVDIAHLRIIQYARMTTTSTKTSTASSAPRLRRSLTLWDLILYGIIVIQPTAPMPAYGVFSNEGQGHVVTSILIAMVAMVFTAMSYGRMERVYS